jgi:hypothetical protein
VLPTREGQVSRWIVIVNLDVGRETCTRVRSFDQVVAEQRVLGKPSVSGFLERIDIVDAFAGEAALAVEILIHVGYSRRVRIDARMS